MTPLRRIPRNIGYERMICRHVQGERRGEILSETLADAKLKDNPMPAEAKQVTSMIYTALTKKAMRIAYDAHQGQVDKAGDPYIFHPLHLAEQMEDELTTCAALLHDVVEDTAVTFEELESEFPPEVMEALRLLTHEEDVPYLDYVAAIAKNPIARAVKLADLEHNSDESRLAGCDSVSEETKARLRTKYAAARAILEG